MLRLTFLIIQFLLILALVVLLVSNTFIISFDIGDYKYSFSSNIFLGGLLGVLFILYIFQYLYFKAKFSFHKYILINKFKKLEKGYLFFVDAMIAIANKDNKKAISSNKKMLTYLKDDPTLSLLLQAEVLKIEKKFDQLSRIYEEMIKRKNTETLGYRGLMEQNLNQQDFHHAFIYGEKLFFLNPKIEKLYDTLIYVIAKTKNWNQLLLITEKAFSQKIIEKDINGLYHYGGRDYLNRLEFAKMIASTFGLDGSLIKPITTSELNWLAQRPLKSGLYTNKIELDLGIEALPIQKALDEMVSQL